MGFETRYQLVDAESCGSAVSQARLVIWSFSRRASRDEREWCVPTSDLPARPMSNCLRPFGARRNQDSCPVTNNDVPDAATDPMPSKCGAWIQTTAGYRRLYADELAKGLGVPSTWSEEGRCGLKARHLNNLVGIHLWEAVGVSALEFLGETLKSPPGPMGPDVSPVTANVRPPTGDLHLGESPENSRPVDSDSSHQHRFVSEDTGWSWEAPNLDYNRTWYKQRIRSLTRVLKRYPKIDQKEMLLAGKADLKRHRENYGPEGAQHLQILWWEFPEQHWESLRIGSSMNFLKQPSEEILPNSDMDEDQLSTASDFFDELVSLGALELCPPDDPLVANAPLFCVPKPGQPGQWRVIANMKEGGQNASIGNDPVYLPRVDTILPYLYSGGWSATVDASKFFYQFPTLQSERRFLGCVHPTTGVHYRYRGLPMGSANSPAIAGRLGAGFIRRLVETFPEYQGSPLLNTWGGAADGKGYDTKSGHGRVLVAADDSDGLPAVLIWVHVDDFFIHGPTQAKTAAALSRFMDLAVDVGLLCNPAKTEPPQQCAKYCGFFYDTVGVPTLQIPEAKRTRALAIIEYLQSKRTTTVSRLCLAVTVGILESLVEATPSGLGHTFLRRLVDLLHDGSELLLNAAERYYTKVVLTDEAWADLEWWRRALALRVCRPVRPLRGDLLTPMWGDGSGTGTGGTEEHLDANDLTLDARPMEMWMGAWCVSVLHYTSNWKELSTLLLSLEREAARTDDRVRDQTVFYFTDNMVTYYLVGSGASRHAHLQALLHRIKYLELSLGCHLECVHVPGTTMIDQGTDGLSRGVWISPLHRRFDSRSLMRVFFSPVSLRPGWHQWLLDFLADHSNPRFNRLGRSLALAPPRSLSASDPWVSTRLLNTITVWNPPPEVARQAISAMMTAWVEQPLTTGAVFFVPRILQRQWQRLSRHLHVLDAIQVDDLPSCVHHTLPVVLIVLTHHVRELPSESTRLDLSTNAATIRWHRDQATFVRGLSTPAQQ
jgi:hypothetical protein